jgi:UDP-N-acetylglucosamine 2-epimerase (non-hydrolysing)
METPIQPCLRRWRHTTTKVAVGHVEAGLRTGDRYSPWPEEMNRRITGALASIHFAPTDASRANLLKEGIDPSTVHVTGNTVIDALMWARERVTSDAGIRSRNDEAFSFLDSSRRMLLVTGHRRENFGQGVEDMCAALRTLAARGDVDVVYPVHLNPSVKDPVHELLGSTRGIHLIEPQDYPAFVHLMDRSYLILTDSGGVQEEAPSLGKPVLVMRDTTERPEAVDAGTVKLVGTNTDRIVTEVSRLLDDPDRHEQMRQAHNPYGDGSASPRIVKAIKNAF